MRYDTNRRPEQIEDDIAHTRSQIDSTLSAIEQRLTKDYLIDQGIDYLRHGSGREFISNLTASAKHNPLPVTLVGIGLAWLMMADRYPRTRYVRDDVDVHVDETLEEPLGVETAEHPGIGERFDAMKGSVASARQRMTDKAHAARQRISDSAHSARERLSETTHAARERASRIGEGARHQWERARGGYDRMLQDQPLALGAIGFAIGALAAAVMPRTRHEDALMGEASDRVAEKAKAAGKEQLEKAQRVAAAAGTAATEAAKDEVRREEDLQGSRSGQFQTGTAQSQTPSSVSSR